VKAIGYKVQGAIDRPEALLDVEIEKPAPGGRDLLVEIKAVSVNPVDSKLRTNAPPDKSGLKILGFDAAGIVAAVGPEATLFKPGDEVFYAGSMVRSGTNAQFHLVDERIVGAKPKSLNWAEAAALPLTTITAWEALFERMDIRRPVPGAANAIVIIGGAGGVGSIAIQLARKLTDVTVIATASRPETIEWCKKMGAHHVVDHTRPLAEQVTALGLGAPAFVFSTNHTQAHVPQIAELIAPQGRLGVIEGVNDITALMRKSISIHWELMFTRSMFQTADIARQHDLLTEASTLVDQGVLKTTLTSMLSPINAANMKRAHEQVESGRTIGKIVIEGF
jgi:zinc-binding alcohol dehydrogenase family protein